MFFASGFLQASVALRSFPLSLTDIATHVPKSAKNVIMSAKYNFFSLC